MAGSRKARIGLGVVAVVLFAAAMSSIFGRSHRTAIAHARTPSVAAARSPKLTNFGGADTFFWGRTGKSTPVIADLLRVGAEIRRRSQ
jgi:hypothetical protein